VVLDTIRLQPLVLQFHSYKDAYWSRKTPPGFSRWCVNFEATSSATIVRHHQALAGGTSTSKLRMVHWFS